MTENMIAPLDVIVPLDVPIQNRHKYQENFRKITKGSDGLMLFAGDQKAEHLNDDFFGPGIDSEDNDPEHLFRIEAQAKIGVFATQMGLIARYGMDYLDVPYLVKLNSKTNLIKTSQAEPRSPQWIDVSQVIDFIESSDLEALSLEDIHRTQRSVTRITSQLKEFCRLLPEGKRESVCRVVKEIELASDFPDKLDKIELAFTYVSSAVETALQLEDVCSNLQREISKATGLILERLDHNQKVIVQEVLKALMESGDQDKRFKELVDKLDAFVSELEQSTIENPALKNDVDEYNYIKDSELNIKDRLVFTIPLIPLFLKYQAIIELQSGISLSEAWDKLTRSPHS